jgi:uncharacterized protein (TIGR02246 family)
MVRKYGPAWIVLVALIGGCMSGPGRDSSTAESATAVGNGMVRALETAFNAGEAEAVAALFTDDAVLMASQQPDKVGRAAILKAYADQFAAYTIQIHGVAVETKLFGDHGFSRGTYEVTLIPKSGGDRIVDGGRFFTLLQRQPDGTWKSIREMSNSEKP